MKRYCLAFQCWDGHKSVIAGDIYTDYSEAEKRCKEVQKNYKHKIEVFEI